MENAYLQTIRIKLATLRYDSQILNCSKYILFTHRFNNPVFTNNHQFYAGLLAENYVAGGRGAEVAISNLENDAGAEDALS
jgi:hypothetical protein